MYASVSIGDRHRLGADESEKLATEDDPVETPELDSVEDALLKNVGLVPPDPDRSREADGERSRAGAACSGEPSRTANSAALRSGLV